MVYSSFVREKEAFTSPKVDSKIYPPAVERNKEEQGRGNVNLKAKCSVPQPEVAAGQSEARTADEELLQPRSWIQTFYGISSVEVFKWTFSLQDQWTWPTAPRAGSDDFAKDPNIKCFLSTPPFALRRAPPEPYLLWPLRRKLCRPHNS